MFNDKYTDVFAIGESFMVRTYRCFSIEMATALSYRQGKQWMHDVRRRLVLERKREIVIKKWAGVELRARTRSPLLMQVQVNAK